MSVLSESGQVAPVERVRGLAPLLIVLGVAIAYPFVVGDLRELQYIGPFFPQLSSVVIMIVFIMMAVGLNIVVGYAGCSTSATSPSTRWGRMWPVGLRPAISSR